MSNVLLAAAYTGGDKAMYQTLRTMPVATAVVLLVLIALALVWVFKKR